ncbi:hypothetical protein E1258_09540 [Micromonospora sp. KC207]|uniref:hypothetical protein n=1 Tax=Micromonospora sp. KC207 TaxID=2530377 RepID=UPI00104FCA92|nr:hypothetical protein [Micromonospora sp. KC207]TDC63878.1 hypothetical protein E1258_09540 [Micromonospora sp. KC207]
MTKSSGLGARLYVAGSDLSGDVGSLSRIGGGPAPRDVTGINKSAYERIGGLRDGGIDYQAWFNPAVGAAHDVLSALPRTDQVTTYCHRATIGSPAACCVAKQIGYDPTRAADGSLTVAVQTQANGYGLEWGTLATAATRTDTAATNGASIDLGAAGSFGLQAYLHVLAFTGTDVTIKLQQSSDDGGGDAFADVTGGGFTQVTGGAPLAERIQTARGQAVERYLRVVTTTTGGFTSLEFVVVVAVNTTSVVF